MIDLTDEEIKSLKRSNDMKYVNIIKHPCCGKYTFEESYRYFYPELIHFRATARISDIV